MYFGRGATAFNRSKSRAVYLEESHASWSLFPVQMGISFDSDPRIKSEDDACCKIPGSWAPGMGTPPHFGPRMMLFGRSEPGITRFKEVGPKNNVCGRPLKNQEKTIKEKPCGRAYGHKSGSFLKDVWLLFAHLAHVLFHLLPILFQPRRY